VLNDFPPRSYLHNPPHYQFLHCVRNRAVKGGESYFSDAFYAASVLRKSHPDAFNILASTPVPFQYINDGRHLYLSHPIIELDSHSNISHINYAPPFQAPLLPSTPVEFYSALKLFADVVNDPAVLFQCLLKEGDAVIFNNRRVLHARRAFSNVIEEQEVPGVNVNRWMKGCYIEEDVMLDRGRILRTRLERGEI